MDEQTSLQVCGIIAGVLIADDHIHPHEARFLQRVRLRLGVAKNTAVAPVGHEEAVVKLRELPEELRQETLGLIVEAAAVDGRIDIGERIFLDAVARELSIGEADLDTLLQQAITKSRPQPFVPAT